VRRRFSEGLQFQANYTFSKTLTDYEGSQNNRTSFRDSENESLDRGRSAIDARHVWNANAVWEVPVGQGRKWGNFSNAFADGLLGGWQINGILGYSSGTPLTITSGRKTLTAPRFGATGFGATATADFFGADPSITNSIDKSGSAVVAISPDEKAQFGFPTAGRAGLSALRYFDGPQFWVLDASLFKSFATPWFSGENSSLQFRAEFFNLTNSVRFNNFNTNFTSPGFGIIGSSRPARVTQLALKFIF